jgi:hypothetical protein
MTKKVQLLFPQIFKLKFGKSAEKIGGNLREKYLHFLSCTKHRFVKSRKIRIPFRSDKGISVFWVAFPTLVVHLHCKKLTAFHNRLRKRLNGSLSQSD